MFSVCLPTSLYYSLCLRWPLSPVWWLLPLLSWVKWPDASTSFQFQYSRSTLSIFRVKLLQKEVQISLYIFLYPSHICSMIYWWLILTSSLFMDCPIYQRKQHFFWLEWHFSIFVCVEWSIIFIYIKWFDKCSITYYFCRFAYPLIWYRSEGFPKRWSQQTMQIDCLGGLQGWDDPHR